MNKLKFGFGQIGNMTPAFAKWVFRVVLYLAAVANLVIASVSEIPEPIKGVIAKYSLEAVALVHGLSRMFGVQVEEPATKDSFTS